jgi:hypothetical protein
MKKFIWVAAIGLVLSAFASASAASKPQGLSQRVLLADYSLDTTPAQRAEAIRIVEEMADLGSAERGMVAAAPFQSSALATIDWPILHTFVPKQSDPNSYYTRIDLQQQADSLKQRAKRLFGRQSDVQGTDLLGGLLAASELFAAEPAGPKTLVVNSNMWLFSRSDRLFLKQHPLTTGQIPRAIARLDRAGKIARLRGVCVYVVGGGLDPRRQIPNSTQVSLRSFWQAYFRQAGAHLVAWTPTPNVDPSC